MLSNCSHCASSISIQRLSISQRAHGKCRPRYPRNILILQQHLSPIHSQGIRRLTPANREFVVLGRTWWSAAPHCGTCKLTCWVVCLLCSKGKAQNSRNVKPRVLKTLKSAYLIQPMVKPPLFSTFIICYFKIPLNREENWMRELVILKP